MSMSFEDRRRESLVSAGLILTSQIEADPDMLDKMAEDSAKDFVKEFSARNDKIGECDYANDEVMDFSIYDRN